MNNPESSSRQTTNFSAAAAGPTGPALTAAIYKERPLLKSSSEIPKEILDVCDKLTGAGFKAWLAGGCVRDFMLARKAKDWDIVTNAPFDKLEEIFPKGIKTGAAFGVLKLPPVKKGDALLQIDIAIFRKESDYTDGRHPDVVEPGDETSDSQRRDFTVNALYLDPVNSKIIDLVGGMPDLNSKVLRAVGNPNARFAEDSLRLMRAARFTAQLGFKLHKETAAAMRKHSKGLERISRERIRDELYKLLSSQKPVAGIETLAQYCLWEPVFGVKRVSVPADLRQLKLSWSPSPFQWLCALGITGLLGDPIKEASGITERLTPLLRLENAERKMLSQILSVYSDPKAYSAKDWVDLAKENKQLLDLVRSFIRRARGVTDAQKQQAILFLEQAQRWAIASEASYKTWPTAATLQKKDKSLTGKALGDALAAETWAAFSKRPV